MTVPSRHEPTPEITKQIADFVLAGAYQRVAAEAAGVPRAVFLRWLARGRWAGATGPCRDLADRVMQAAAQARLLAETKLFVKDPKTWLKSGPGKESPGNPGWSKEVAPIVPARGRTCNVLASPQWQALWTRILAVLADFPEARVALAAALQDDTARPPSPGEHERPAPSER
jgi:hypothetical protein